MVPEKRTKVWVKPHAVIAPKTNEFHQHFNVADGPFRQLAVRANAARYGTGQTYDPRGSARNDDRADPSYKLSFTQEDPQIREEFYAELERRGIHRRLAPVDQ